MAQGLSEIRDRLKPGNSGSGGGHEDGERSQKDESRQQRDSSGTPVKSSHVIEEHIDVGVPRDVAYSQWTQYRELPKYSKKESAEPKRQERISFTSKIGPSTRHWDADVMEQEPPKRIAWRSIGGAQNMGVVTFHRLDDRLTRVMVEMEYHPKGFMEVVGNFFRMQRRRVRKDLKLFKHFIELRGEATGKGAGRVRGEGLTHETDERLGQAAQDGPSEAQNGRSERSGNRQSQRRQRQAS